MALSRRGTNGFRILEYVIDNGRATASDINKNEFGVNVEEKPSQYSGTYSGLTREGILENNGRGYEVTHYGLHVYNTLPYPKNHPKDEVKAGGLEVLSRKRIKDFTTLHFKILEHIYGSKKSSAETLLKVFGREAFEIEVSELIASGLVSFDKEFYRALGNPDEIKREYGLPIDGQGPGGEEVKKNSRLEILTAAAEEIKYYQRKLKYQREDLKRIGVMGGSSYIPLIEEMIEETIEQIKGFKREYGHSTLVSLEKEVEQIVGKKGKNVGRQR